jgi:hypothetical protein
MGLLMFIFIFLSSGNIFGLNLPPVLVGDFFFAVVDLDPYELVLILCCLMRIRIRKRYLWIWNRIQVL